MHSLPDIVKAITLNNKLDESRDFATLVQRAMIENLAKANGGVRDRGVKQAPFVVLIGAGMPSVLAEISFMTHSQEGKLLKTHGLPPADRRGAVPGHPALPAVAESGDGRRSGGVESDVTHPELQTTSRRWSRR